MCAVANGEVVVSGLKHPCAHCTVCLLRLIVITCEILRIKSDRHCLGCARLQNLCLGETDQLDGGFLDLVLPFVVAIGRLGIDFDGGLSCDLARVGDRDGDRHGSVIVLDNVLEIIGVRRIREAVPKGIGDLIGIVPGGPKGSSGGRCGVALS